MGVGGGLWAIHGARTDQQDALYATCAGQLQHTTRSQMYIIEHFDGSVMCGHRRLGSSMQQEIELPLRDYEISDITDNEFEPRLVTELRMV